MKFTADRDILYAQLVVSKCVRGASWIGLTISDGKLTIQTGDSALYVSATFPVTDAVDGEVLVDRKLLITCIATLNDGPVHVSTTKKRLRVQQGTRRRYVPMGSIDLLPIKPTIGDELVVTYPIKALLAQMRKVKFALAGSDGDITKVFQQALIGYYFDAKSGNIFAADGDRVAYTPLPGPLTKSFLVSPQCETALVQMAKSDDEVVTLRCTPPGWIEMKTESATVRVATIGYDYPIETIRRVCEQTNIPDETTVTTEKKRLLPLLKMALGYGELAKSEQTKPVVLLNLNPTEQVLTLAMRASTGNMEDILSEVTCIGPTEVVVGLDPIYLNQAIQATRGDFINLSARSSHEPVVIRCEDLTIIQMVMGGVDVAAQYRATQEEDDDSDF